MLHLVWSQEESEAAWSEGRDCCQGYLQTILRDLGLPFRQWNHEDWMKARPFGLTLVAGGTRHPDWPAACEACCEQGNAVLAIGGLHGLNEILGVADSSAIREGGVDWGHEPLARGMGGSFHWFDAAGAMGLRDDVSRRGTLVSWDGDAGETYPAVTLRKIGPGAASLFAVDLMKTLIRLQQGVPVDRDGEPAPDGTAAIDDGFLKTDDGFVLDWDRDREPAEPDRAPLFLHPVADEWKTVFVRLVHELCEMIGFPMAQIWYWPRGLPAIGHISHDSDGNSPAHADNMLARLREAGVRSTWCIIMPGYDETVNRRIVAEGHEIALHYDSLDAEWSEDHFAAQLSMLRGQFPQLDILANKNHYLRWEGGSDFYRWCEREGIRVEQSKGGTKPGNKGFLFGSCHPFAPVAPAAEENRVYDVISLPTLAWDPPMPVRCTKPEAFALLRRAAEASGVGHFLFHPAMLDDGENAVGNMLVELVEYGRLLGMEWWTAGELWIWRTRRSSVRLEFAPAPDGGLLATVHAETETPGVTLLVGPQFESASAAAGGPGSSRRRLTERFGLPFSEFVFDLPAGTTEIRFG